MERKVRRNNCYIYSSFISWKSNFKCRICFIGDSLTGKGAGWGQKNTYATQTYDANSDPMLKDYYKGGKYGQSVINDYYFNDVALSSSYSGGINKAQPFGTLHEGEEMNNTFTLPLPKSINLKKSTK